MVNHNRNRENRPPTGEGKHQSPFKGEPRKLNKRSDVVQAQRGHELNLGDSDEEAARDDASSTSLDGRLDRTTRGSNRPQPFRSPYAIRGLP
jgi:hypothetical protein